MMKKMLTLVLALCLLLPLLAAAETVPTSATLVLDSGAAPALFLPDGGLVYVPWQMDDHVSLPHTELRRVDAAGRLLWSCTLPAFRALWGGLYPLSGGDFLLFAELNEDNQWMQYILSGEGHIKDSRALPRDIFPLMAAGDRIFGSLQGQEAHQLFQINLDGSKQPYQIPAVGDNATVMRSMPNEAGHLLHAVGKLSQEEDISQRTADQVLLYLDEKGGQARHARLHNKKFVEGFAGDAVFNPQGGLTALVKDDYKDIFNRFSVICFDENGTQVWEKQYSLEVHSVSAQLINRLPAGGYLIHGAGTVSLEGQEGFVFRLEVDADGGPLAFSVRASKDGRMVRDGQGQPLVFNGWPPAAWAAPLESLPEMDVQMRVVP